MLHRFDAAINGRSIGNIDPAIILTDIIEDKADEERQEARRGLRAGMRITSRVRRSLQVRLAVAIREYDAAPRAALMDKIADWLGDGGWLTINSRPGQRLRVIPDELPTLGSSQKWNEDIEINLIAYERPYWEQQWPTRAIITDTGVIRPTGTVPTAYVECDVTNAGDSELTTLTVTCADTVITLAGLAVPAGGKVRIGYTDDDVLQITADGKTALANRTAESSDDLVAYVRKGNDIRVQADQPVSAVFSARGRYR